MLLNRDQMNAAFVVPVTSLRKGCAFTQEPRERRRNGYYVPVRRVYQCNSAAGREGVPREEPVAHEKVEDGVKLPKASNAILESQSSWLETELRDWLDREWREMSAWRSHREIGQAAARLYRRLRAEGEDDLSAIMLAIGDGLEGMNFSETYVGSWNVANKAAELLLERCSGKRSVSWEDELANSQSTSPRTLYQHLEKQSAGDEETEVARKGTQRRPASPNLADAFERYRFLQNILEGTTPKEIIDGAVAVAMGFEYNIGKGAWDGSNVEDEHFKQFGNTPPDILGDENIAEWTESLKYLELKLELDKDEDGQVLEGLNTVIETLHGADITALQREDPNDHAFHKREAVVKWLHIKGGF